MGFAFLIGAQISWVWFSASDYFSLPKGDRAKPLIRPVPLSALLFEDTKQNKKKVASASVRPSEDRG